MKAYFSYTPSFSQPFGTRKKKLHQIYNPKEKKCPFLTQVEHS
jgi:hypothetical protein